MREIKKSGNIEKQILLGMILHKTVLSRISLHWTDNSFPSKWGNMIGGYCVHFFRKYQESPGRAIQDQFQKWGQKFSDEGFLKLLDSLLTELDDEAAEAEINPEYVIDQAGEYFSKIRMERLTENIQDALDDSRTEDAERILSEYRRIELGVGAGITLENEEAIEAALTEKRQSIIQFPGALGQFWGDELERDGFIAFLGPEKRGKSWWLMDMAYRGLIQHRKVAWFEVGDMSQNQAIRRLISRICKRPLRAGSVQYPVEMECFGDSAPEIVFEDKSWISELLPGVAMERVNKLIRKGRRGERGKMLRLASYPNSSVSVEDIRQTLEIWDQENWTPDVIIIDYADILRMDYSGMDKRNQINETWKGLRRISQERHCLLVTATQSNAESYDAQILSRRHFSEDKRKYAHITGMVGINQTEEEREKGLYRLNWMMKRESEYYERKWVWVAGCLGVANPAVRSCFAGENE